MDAATLADMEPRPLTVDDLDWVTGLAAARRARLAPFAPRFWNPSPDARAMHAESLGRLIGSPDVLAVRSEHGFLFGLPRPGRLLVDDMLVDDMVLTDDARWADKGTALLRHAARAAASGRMSVAARAAEEETGACLLSVGHRLRRPGPAGPVLGRGAAL